MERWGELLLMGADMCIQYVAFRGNNLNEFVPEEYKLRLIESVNEATFGELQNYEQGYDEDDLGVLEMREKLIEVINEFFNCLDNRDVTCINHKGDRIYLTGGMSWGDNPTDSYGNFERLNYIDSDILNRAGIQ